MGEVSVAVCGSQADPARAAGECV